MFERFLSKILALAVLLLLAVPAVIVANFGWSTIQQKREALDDAQLTLTRLQNAAALTVDPALPGKIAAKFEDYKSKPAARGTLVAGLQERLRGLAQQAQVDVVQMAEVAVSEEKLPYEKITLKLQVSGLAANMVQFFTLVEASKPLLLIDGFGLRPSAVIAVNAQTEAPLEAEFDVTGFAANSEAAP